MDQPSQPETHEQKMARYEHLKFLRDSPAVGAYMYPGTLESIKENMKQLEKELFSSKF